MPNTKEVDMVLCSIPRMSIYYPPPAAGILKAYLNSKNISNVVLDFVLEFHEKYFGTDEWDRIVNWIIVPGYRVDDYIVDLLNNEIDQWVEQIYSYNPKWIGISVFSYESHKITKLLIYKLKSKNVNCKIVLGGAGITDDSNNYAQDLYNKGLIDKFILGDGEGQILELFDYENDFVFSESLVPDWSDYDLDAYTYQQNKVDEVWKGFGNYLYANHKILTLPITGSRGCVRKCSFCDIPKLWPKFQYRSAENILNEIITNYKKHDVTRFHFTDSLVNGNRREFRILCKMLAQERTQNNYNFSFTGQYICRNSYLESDEEYQLIAAAGFKVLEVGIESGSEAVRTHMGKNFTNDDIRMFMKRCSDNNIKIVFMLIVGYPTETEEDFQQTLDILTEFEPYVKNNTIIEACLGGTLRIEPGTKLRDDPNASFYKSDDLHWTWKSNPELTLEERINRRYRILKHAIALGYFSPTNNQEIMYLESQK